MNLGEMRAWVLRTIKRPDLTQEAVDAINAAIEFASTFGDFYWDLVEGTKTIDGTVYAQSLVIATEFPRFRKIKYLRPSSYRKYLSGKTPDRIYDKNGCEFIDTFYLAGANLVFKLSNLQTLMLYGYYTYPMRLSDISLSNQYLLQMPATIHDLACSRLYEDNGNEAEALRLQQRALRFLNQHKSDKQDGISLS